MKTDGDSDRVFLPVCLNIGSRKIAMVGGGRVAWQKLSTLIQYTGNIRICAPRILPEILHLGLECLEQKYAPSLLAGAVLVFACTDKRELNRRIALDARRLGIPVCTADDPAFCDFVSPAIYKRRNMSVAISSNAKNVCASVAWRNRIRELIENDSSKWD